MKIQNRERASAFVEYFAEKGSPFLAAWGVAISGAGAYNSYQGRVRIGEEYQRILKTVEPSCYSPSRQRPVEECLADVRLIAHNYFTQVVEPRLINSYYVNLSDMAIPAGIVYTVMAVAIKMASKRVQRYLLTR